LRVAAAGLPVAAERGAFCLAQQVLLEVHLIQLPLEQVVHTVQAVAPKDLMEQYQFLII
jgi:hypothetical protein